MGTCESFCKKPFNTQKSDTIQNESPYKIKIDEVIDEDLKGLKLLNITIDQTKLEDKTQSNSTQIQFSCQNILNSKPGIVEYESLGNEEANIEMDDCSINHQISNFPIEFNRYNRFIQCNKEEIESGRYQKKKKRKKSRIDRLKKQLKEQLDSYSRRKQENRRISFEDEGSIIEKSQIRNISTSSNMRGILKNHTKSADSVRSQASSSQSQDKKSVSFSKDTNFNPPRKGKHRMLSVSQQEFVRKLRVILEKSQ